MGLNVFLSFSVDPGDQVLIWRLQTLATAQGIALYVPLWQVVENRRSGPLPQVVRAAIDRADCVLAIITTRTGPKVRDEINYALQKNKLIVPLIEKSVPFPPIFKKLPQVFSFTQGEPPGRLESEVVQFLKEQQFKKEAGQQLGAVIAIGLGLLALAALAQD
ncbi:MAG TPA: toll/interleukin-1 receptor domain-containing protein [Verrucomicrobiae bacterium]|nr:toll/interleukin-1 receptor domain-containing protein [Verrucomicrobiae bacterium]